MKTVLETKRLFLQEAELNDAPFFYELLNSPNWLKYIGNRGIYNLEDAQAYIQQGLIKSYKKNDFGLYKMILKDKKVPIGICGLLQRDYLDHPDIGFATLPTFESQGYTFEAAQSVVNYSKSRLKLNQIMAITSENNQRSQALLKKIGMRHIDQIYLSGDDQPKLLFST